MTRLGKIARLPHDIREQLNNRLLDGEQAKHLLDWLNSLPKVKKVLKEDFGGRPVNAQNLSEWKLGGYEDWRKGEEAAAWARSLLESSEKLESAADGPLVELLMAPVAVALGKLLETIMKNPDDPGHKDAVLEVAGQITKLYKVTAAAEQARIQREKWEAEQEKEMEKRRSFAKHMGRIKEFLRNGGKLDDYRFKLDDDEDKEEDEVSEVKNRILREYEVRKRADEEALNKNGNTEGIKANQTESNPFKAGNFGDVGEQSPESSGVGMSRVEVTLPASQRPATTMTMCDENGQSGFAETSTL